VKESYFRGKSAEVTLYKILDLGPWGMSKMAASQQQHAVEAVGFLVMTGWFVGHQDTRVPLASSVRLSALLDGKVFLALKSGES
jgi:hypothetical protein